LRDWSTIVDYLVHDGGPIIQVIHMEKVIKLPRKYRISNSLADEIKNHIDEFDMSDEARAELDNSLYRITNIPGRRWCFAMINPEQFRFVTKSVQRCRNVATTLSVWNAAITYLRMDTGEIMADREQLAKDAETLPRHVSTAMTELSKIGAIIKEKRGRKTAYFINPHVGWAGGEGTRKDAAEGVPKLRLVPGGKVEPEFVAPARVGDEGLLKPAIRFLRETNAATRRLWAARAVAKGAPETPDMHERKSVPRWAPFVAMDLDRAGLLPEDREGEP